MALSGILQLGDNHAGAYSKSYKVVTCRVLVGRGYNQFRPDQDAMGKALDVTFIAPTKEDLNLYEWYISGASQSGRLVIDLSNISLDNTTAQKIIEFEDATCYSLEETYDISAPVRRLFTFGIMAERLTINEQTFKSK